MSKTRSKAAPIQPKPRTDERVPAIAQSSFPDLAIWLGLILAVFIIYGQAGHFDFVTWDDGEYVYENTHVQTGLTFDNIKWAFTAVVSSNWMPVTLLSHLLDGQLFQMQSGMHHLVNPVFHALAAILLFAALQRATRARAASAFVAFVFAVHPLHVESVAWVSERKDVLSALFGFLALYMYVRYTEQPSVRRYLVVVVPFCLGLLAKPMLVTFPFVLLLFDVWPLRRLQFSRLQWIKIVQEKVPLIALSAADAGVAYFTQSTKGAVWAIPLATRVQNALTSYVAYIAQIFWPTRMAFFYPYAQSIAGWRVAAAVAVLLTVSVVAAFAIRSRAYFTMGWFWFVGMLIPVIGLVQVGSQSRADRYTYMPMVGLSVIVAWGAVEVLEKWPRAKAAAATAGVIICVVCMALSWVQAGYWQNSETLFQHAIDVTKDNWVAEVNLGEVLVKAPGRSSEAIAHLKEGLRVQPLYAEAHNTLGAYLTDAGQPAQAIPEFESALKLKKDFADAEFNLALALSKVPGRGAEAVAHYEANLRLRPDHEEAHKNLAVLLVGLGRTQDAIPHLEAALRLQPGFENEHNLGAVLSMLPGKRAEAIAHLEAAQRLRPDAETVKLIERLRPKP